MSSTSNDGVTLWRDGRPVYDRGDTVCVIGAGASGLAAIKNLARARLRRRLLRAGDRRRRRLELAARPQPGVRQHPPDLVEAVHPVPRLPDAGRLAGLPAPQPAAGLPRALRRPLRPAAAHLVRHRGGPGRAGRRRPAGTSPPAAPAGTAPSAPTGTPPWWSPTGTTGRRRCPAYEGLEEFRGEVMHAVGVQGPDAAARHAGAGRRRRQHRLRHRGRGRPAGGADCWHSTRRGYWYAPKYVFGRPADQVNDSVLRAAAAAAGAPVAVPPHAAADRRRPDPVRAARRPTTRSTRPTRSPTASSSTTSGHGAITPVPDVARFHRSTASS